MGGPGPRRRPRPGVTHPTRRPGTPRVACRRPRPGGRARCSAGPSRPGLRVRDRAAPGSGTAGPRGPKSRRGGRPGLDPRVPAAVQLRQGPPGQASHPPLSRTATREAGCLDAPKATTLVGSEAVTPAGATGARCLIRSSIRVDLRLCPHGARPGDRLRPPASPVQPPEGRAAAVHWFRPAVTPPSTGSTEPVTHEARSEARKRIASATSIGWPLRPIGWKALKPGSVSFACSGVMKVS